MTIHVIGAGLAGLSAAVALAAQGRPVCVYEAAMRAGGRCRSYVDPELQTMIDNGGHLILGANHATFDLLDMIGSRHEVEGVVPAAFPFLDLETHESWALRPNAGPLPWWPFSPARRVPRTRIRDYGALIRMLAAGRSDTVARLCSPESALYRDLIAPLTTAVMNAAPEEAAARPMARVLRETLLKGEAGCRPFIARTGLSSAFADPAIAFLARHGATVRFQRRLQRLVFAGDRVEAMEFPQGRVPLTKEDAVILAVPSWSAAALVPGAMYPTESRGIVNAHFRLDGPARLPGGAPLLGLTGGTAQWLIARHDVISVTISAADALLDTPHTALLPRLWNDVATAIGRKGDPMPPARLIKERRATIAQTPASERLRPAARTRWRNLVLAGDWTATGLPATIEGAIRAGRTAAKALI